MIGLVDCNNFYASCEEVFNPKLKRKPLVILSNNDGCVIARSKKAKEIGIEMGAPAFILKQQIELGQLKALSSNFPLYGDMSRRVMETLETYSPQVEIYSIDEAFLEVPASNQVEWASFLQRRVGQWTGIPVSIGMGPTKTLAKIATRIAKKRGEPFLLDSADVIQTELEKTALADIWGIGRQLALKLQRSGIYTAAQFRDREEGWLRPLVGIAGWRTALELKGVCCFELLEEPEKKQSITCSRTFGRPIQEAALLEEAIAAFINRASEKLRAQQSQARFLSVFLQSGFPRISESYHFSLPVATSHTPDLIGWGKRALSQIARSGVSYKKGGVVLADFVEEGVEQPDFFAENPGQARKKQAMQAIDRINAAYGKEVVRFLAEGVERSWKGVRLHQTPRYTTCWEEFLIIN